MKFTFTRILLYFSGNIALRLIGLFLLPIYTRLLSTSEYGIWGLVNSIGQFLSIIMPLGMLMAVGRFYFDANDDAERAESLGTIFFFLAFFPLIFLTILEKNGSTIFNLIIPSVPFDPYIRITIWSTYLSVFSIIPLMILRSREQSQKYIFFTVGQTFFYHILTAILVIFLKQGVLGMITANFIANIIFSIIFIIETIKWFPPRISITRLINIFRYSFPLIIHSFAGWSLMLSDRIILQQWVSLQVIGIYSIGYTIGSISQNAADAATSAWFPIFYQSRKIDGDSKKSILTASYILLVVAAISILITISSHHIIGWLIPESYRGSEQIIIWVAISGIFIQIYNILSYSIHYIKKTWFLIIISWGSAITNLIINFTLIKTYGYIVAAISTFVSYFLMALLTYFIVRKIDPIHYEYRRWISIILSTIIICFGSAFRLNNLWGFDLLYSFFLFACWPVCLFLSGFFSEQDIHLIKNNLIYNFLQQKIEIHK